MLALIKDLHAKTIECNLNSFHIMGRMPVLDRGTNNCNDDKLSNIWHHVKAMNGKLICLSDISSLNPV